MKKTPQTLVFKDVILDENENLLVCDDQLRSISIFAFVSLSQFPVGFRYLSGTVRQNQTAIVEFAKDPDMSVWSLPSIHINSAKSLWQSSFQAVGNPSFNKLPHLSILLKEIKRTSLNR